MQRPGAWFVWRWWEQEGLDLAYASYQAAEAADGEEGRRVGEEKRRHGRRQQVGIYGRGYNVEHLTQ